MYGNLNEGKKLANILFNITYKKYENPQDSNYSMSLSKIENYSHFNEESVLPFIYYGIKNQTILLNGSSNYKDFTRHNNKNFFSSYSNVSSIS